MSAEQGGRGYGRALPFVFDDGGRAAAGFKGSAGDCVARAIAIATGLDYRAVYDELAERNALAKPKQRRDGAPVRRPRSARNGVAPSVYKAWLSERGWVWTPTMAIGSGTTVHLRANELPTDTVLIARLSRHLVAVVEGVVHDTFDPCREGNRAVYGFWTPHAMSKGWAQ